MSQTTIARESRARRAAARSGLAVHKSRRTGGYVVADASTTGVVAGWGDNHLDLDGLEAWLESQR